MFSFKLRPYASVALAMGLLFAAGAQAQATRTWVSGVGDDANPCSRTAPCKTFAGAISKTAANGEINVLDPGAFGTVTITKAITITGEGQQAGVLASGTNAIVVNAGVNDVVILRNLNINGIGTGLNGVRFLAGKELHLEQVKIWGFTQSGVDFEPSGTSRLYVNDSIISRLVGTDLAYAGVLLKPTATGKASAVIDRSRIEGNHIGLRIEDRSDLVLQSSVVSGNAQFGAWVRISSAAASMFAADTVFAHNGPVNLTSPGTGVRSQGVSATVRLAKSVVTGSQLGLSSVTGGAILSYGDNRISGNVSDGAPTGFVTEI